MKLMKILKTIVVCLTFVSVPLISQAIELAKGTQETIFVGELKIQSSVADQARQRGKSLELSRAMQTLDSEFTNALSATRVFQLVERKRKGDIELEQGFAAVSVDPNDKSAAQAGKMAGAKFAFLPQINGFEDITERIEQSAIGRSSIERKLYISAVVQVVDTTTGKLLPDAPSISVTKEEVISARSGQAQTSDQLLVELVKEAAQKLSQELVAQLRPAKILAITGQQITINRGTEAGFKVGDLVEVFASRDITDEDTGETFREELRVGNAKIIRSDKKKSAANIGGENLGIAKGCIVKPVPKDTRIEDSDSMEQTAGSSDKPVTW